MHKGQISEPAPEPPRPDQSVNSSTRAFDSFHAPPVEETPQKQIPAWWWALLALVLAIAVGAAIYFLPLFKVSDIRVEGARTVPTETIVEATGIQKGANLMRVSTKEAAYGVASLPRISEASVRRQFPDKLVATVVERRVVAYRESAGAIELVDEHGATFIDGEPPTSAIRIDGGEDGLVGAVAVAAALPEPIAEQVDHIRIDGPRAFVLSLHDGREIYWGAAEDNENKALALETVLQREGGYWDISDPQMVITR